MPRVSAIVRALSFRQLLLLFSFFAFSHCGVSSAEEPRHAAQAEPLRVVSYNIKRGLGNDGQTDLDRTAEVLKRLNPDFVGLQEVDEGTKRSGGVDQAAQLGQKLDMHHAFAPFMNYDGGRYGLAVLSKFPIIESKAIALPVGNEPRVALAFTVEIEGQRVTFVNVHFDWVRDDEFRFAQATTLKASLDKLKYPYVLLGDFNDEPASRTVSALGKGALEAKKPERNRMTFSSTQPKMEIDYIFCAPESRWQVGEVSVIDEPIASDHRPVVAELTLRRRPPNPH